MLTNINQNLILRKKTIQSVLIITALFLANDVLAGTDSSSAGGSELKAATDEITGLVKGTGMKIGLTAAAFLSLIVGMTTSSLAKPAMTIVGVTAGAGGLFSWIDAKYTALI